MPFRVLESRIDVKMLVVFVLYAAFAVYINIKLPHPQSLMVMTTCGGLAAFASTALHHKLKEEERTARRVCRELQVTQNSLLVFMPEGTLQKQVDAELQHLASCCLSYQKQLKSLSQGGLAALNILQTKTESDEEYIQRAENKRRMLTGYFEHALHNFEARYNLATETQNMLRISLRGKNYRLYLPPAEAIEPAA